MSLLTLIGVLHTSYWLMVLGAGIVREKYAHSIRQKFLCTYIPVLYHVFIHIYAGRETVHEMEEATHDHHSIQWLLIGTMAAGILIVLGEYWLHRTTHCMTHHSHAHKHCHDEECEEEHQSH